MLEKELIKRLNLFGDLLKKALLMALISDGKQATGTLVQSIEISVFKELNKIVLEERHEFYGDFVDRGRKPGVRRVPIDALEDWIRVLQFSIAVEETRGLAFAIQTNIFKFGIERSGWLTDTLEDQEALATKEIQKEIEDQMTITFDNLANRTQKSFAA